LKGVVSILNGVKTKTHLVDGVGIDEPERLICRLDTLGCLDRKFETSSVRLDHRRPADRFVSHMVPERPDFVFSLASRRDVSL
jgi:hypothetical protein